VVTTNYDFQLERAFQHFAPSRWAVYVRHGQGRDENDEGMTWIHKMHGSFRPDPELLRNYHFSEAFRPKQAQDSIVITENDYDDCYREIGKADPDTASLLQALGKTCVIIGKSLDAQDISFMYALRKTRIPRRKGGRRAFMLFNDPLTPADKLNVHNLGIDPLVINLPRSRDSGHYYFGLVAALARLFPRLRGLFEEAKQDPGADVTLTSSA
jgi:hypothetical protein